MIVPPFPMAHPTLGEIKKTEERLAVIPFVCEIQVVPPFVVFKIVLSAPTAQPVVWLINTTETSEFPVG